MLTRFIQELGYFPLAIIQAAAYIASNRMCNLKLYLDIYQERRQELLEDYKHDTQRLDSYRGTVYTTWNISFEHLRQQNHLAATFLRVCGFLHHESISESIFQNAAARVSPLRRSSIPPSEVVMTWITNFVCSFMGKDETTWDTLKYLRVIHDLRCYSLVNLSTGSEFSIHLLVHDWIRNYEIDNDVKVIPAYTSTLLGLSIAGSITSDKHHNTYYAYDRSRLLPHVQEVRRHDQHLEVITMVWFGHIYMDSAKYEDAEYLQAMVMDTRKCVLGEGHPDTLTSMNNLASTYWKQGRWTEAEELLVTVTEAQKRLLGEERPDTIASMHNLASTYSNQGRLTEAEGLQVTATEACKRLLGEEHPNTLTSMNNLASTYALQGRWTEAEGLQVTVTEARKRLLGEEHPDTLASINNLAWTCSNQARWMEAEGLQVMVMETSKRVLGQEHPDTLTRMNNLAFTYHRQGRLTEAEAFQVIVKDSRKRVLGEEHPDTMMAMENLAATYRGQGKIMEAEDLEEKVDEIEERVRSKDPRV